MRKSSSFESWLSAAEEVDPSDDVRLRSWLAAGKTLAIGRRGALQLIQDLDAEFFRSPDSNVGVRRVVRAAALREAVDKLRFHVGSVTSSDGSVDIAIVCALQKPELDAVLRQPLGWRPEARAGDPVTFHHGVLDGPTRSLSVVAAGASQMGMPASAILATRLIHRFQPKIVAMVGIAAGARGKAQGFGDILVPDCLFDYGSGKTRQQDGRVEFAPDPNPLALDSVLKGRIGEWRRRGDVLREIEAGWPHARPKTALQMHVGPLGSGSQVLGERSRVKETLRHWRKLVGVEMEAYGVHLAADSAVRPAPMFICAKSICDFASGKKDDWQEYAAYTSTAFLLRFLTEEFDGLV